MDANETDKVKSTIALLSSMVVGGEPHSGLSLEMKNEALNILNHHTAKSEDEAHERYEKAADYINRGAKFEYHYTTQEALRIASGLIEYGEYDGQRFPVGSKITSLENGELIIAPEGTPEEEIVHTVKADD